MWWDGQGSSPRLRGAPKEDHKVQACFGLIPASAGSTQLPAAILVGPWAHPRVCGEHCISASSSTWALGSSPRLRGAHSSASSSAKVGGLIPASAGSTCEAGVPAYACPAHPRVCGEHKYG